MNQIDKEKDKLKKELLKLATKSMKKRTYKFKYVDKQNSEGFGDMLNLVINELNNDVSSNGFTLSYENETKRSETTKFCLSTVYTVTVNIASGVDKLIGKSVKAKARDGDDISW